MAKTNKDDKSLFRRLSRLFSNGPLVKRKIKTADTTVAVPDKTKSSGALLFQKSLSPTYATITANAYNLSERLMRYQDFCFGRETLVYTLEGVFTIEELAKKYPSGEQFFVYSYDYENKCPTIGTAFMPRVANGGTPTKRVRITFDDGGHVDVTPDHRMLLRDGTPCEAEKLMPGDSLMPLYVRSECEDGYNTIYLLEGRSSTGRAWTREHVFVAKHFFANQKASDVIHHKDFNKKNNHPSNLQVITATEHAHLHAQINNVNKLGKPNESHSKWMAENGNRKKDLTFDVIVKQCLAFESLNCREIADSLECDVNMLKLRLREAGFSNWVDFRDRFDDAMRAATHGVIVKESRSPSFEEIKSVTGVSKSLDEVASRLSCSRQAINRRLVANGISSWVELKTGKAYTGKKRGPTYDGPSYQEFCSAFKPGMTQVELASVCNTTKNKLGTCLKNNGFVSFTKWSETFQNHKVVSVTPIDDDIVYTITVEKHHNLAVGSANPSDVNSLRPYSMIFVMNCEMEYTPEIAAALNIYADETCAQDDKGRVLHVYSDNEKIKETLEDLYYNTLNVEFNMRGWARNLVKYGDLFLYIDVSPNFGVINAFPVPVNEIEREENFDKEDPFAIRFRWVTLGNRTLENWEIAHFRLLGNDMFLPYGSSVIEAARRIWRQLILIEDAMLVYRVVRAPERRVFYIDVANLPADAVGPYMEEQKRALRSNQVIDRNSGRVDLRYNPMSVDEDYFIAVRGGESGTKIDTLAGGQNAAAVEDVAYIQKKLFAALQIPRAYLGYDELLSSKATLAQEDIRFSRTINIIQKTIIAELNKIGIIHLYAHGFDGEDLQNFTLRLSNPSTVAQQQKLELWRTKFELAGSAPEGFIDRNFVRKNIWGLNDEECKAIDHGRLQDKVIDNAIESGGSGGGGSPGDESSGGEDLFGDMGSSDNEGGEEPAEETPPEENAGENPEEETEPNVSLLTSSDNESDETFSVKLSGIDTRVPISARKELDRALYNRGRRRTHGASKTHFPDFKKMTSNDNEAMQDPFDSNWMRSVVSNPLGESGQKRIKIGLSQDMKHTLSKLDSVMGDKINRYQNSIISENIDVDLSDLLSDD